MVGTWIDLHISGLRHVAVDTLVARAAFCVKAVCEWFDHRCLFNSARVATHAKQVVLYGEDCFKRVWVVAILATYVGVSHAAHFE